MICENAARKLNADPRALFRDQVRAVRGILNANPSVHKALSARLLRKSTIGPDALKRYLKGVKHAAAVERLA